MRGTLASLAIAFAALVPGCSKSDETGNTSGAGGGGGAPPLPIDTLTAIAVGQVHSCALADPGGRVVCWGGDAYGQASSLEGSITAAPLLVPIANDVVTLSLGFTDSCALHRDGTVRCWGEHDLGDGAGMLSDIVTIEAIAVGAIEACAIAAGNVYCWGAPPADPLDRMPPEALAGVSGATALVVGGNHACALLGTGRVMCWGSNASGQLGNPAATSDAAIEVAGLTDAIAIAASAGTGSAATCVARSSGAIACWGRVPYQPQALINGAEDAPLTGSFVGVLAGATAVCGIEAGGSATCIPAEPCLPATFTGFSKIALRNGHACAIGGSGSFEGEPLDADDAVCWGADDFGQLGAGQVATACSPAGKRVPLPD